MISLDKFLNLERSARLRKLWRIVNEWEVCLRSGDTQSSEARGFLVKLSQVMQDKDSSWYEPELFSLAILLQRAGRDGSPANASIRAANDARHFLAKQIGKEAAEWDLLPPFQDETSPVRHEPSLGGSGRIVYCDDIRSPFNVGSIFRTAEAFGFDEIVLSPRCPQPDNSRLRRSAMGACDLIPWRVMEFVDLVADFAHRSKDCGASAFAIELGGDPVETFAFPEMGIAVLGSEELGVQPGILAECDAGKGRVSIALRGTKASLNVGVSFGIVAAAWCKKK